ncbi:MAG: four helix bundle protein [Candidatus Gracilibacteria bacterium]
MFDFERFPVYQKAEVYYTDILQILLQPRIDKNLKSQLRRASLSIVLNIAEGSGKFTKNDKKNFYIIAKGSVNECIAILRILLIEKHVRQSTYNNLYEKLTVLAKMLSGLINTMTERKNGGGGIRIKDRGSIILILIPYP